MEISLFLIPSLLLIICDGQLQVKNTSQKRPTVRVKSKFVAEASDGVWEFLTSAS